jgi:2,3-bisphosphoglycerate-dependent phosphoglycerate mutase
MNIGETRMGKKIYIIRHCEAKGQPPESPLTEKGNIQALELSEFFSGIKIDKIVSSPYLRAVQTIEPLANKLNLEIELDSRLTERILSQNNLPDWMEKLRATFEDLELKYDGGESSREAMNRIVEVVKEIKNSKVESAVIVTHGNIMSLLLEYYNKDIGFELWQGLSNPDVYLLQSVHNEFRIERLWEKKF